MGSFELPALFGEAVGAAGETAGSFGGTAETANTAPEESFSVIDWDGYPANLPKPGGPFRLLEGDEYSSARQEAKEANRIMHMENPSLGGLQIHEIQPVKFGGGPTDPLNKIPLTPDEQVPATIWWNRLQRDLKGK